MYYCKHCGQPYQSDEAVICVSCGAPKGKGANFCHNCGGQLDTPGAAICMRCGVPTSVAASGAKSKIAAGLLGIFLGGLGVHNFYLGYTKKAVIQLVLTILGGCLSCIGVGVIMIAASEIWGLVEGIMILAGSISTDSKGVLLRD